MNLGTISKLKGLVPPFLRPMAKSVLMKMMPASVKYNSEVAFWRSVWEEDGRCFRNDYYEGTMLSMAQEADGSFLEGKVVADFGCGPRGSLAWAKSARLRIGIDVLVKAYAQFGIKAHDMVYVECSEAHIPLPPAYVDVMFTLNAMDHVSDFETVCGELRRVMAPGALLIGSFNLDEEPTLCEPQTLTEERVKECLLKYFEVETYRMAAKGPVGKIYSHFTDGSPQATKGERYLWVRARKAS
jgi:ubiquinone/menaquinone biosynthesis C-methylase UbiE